MDDDFDGALEDVSEGSQDSGEDRGRDVGGGGRLSVASRNSASVVPTPVAEDEGTERLDEEMGKTGDRGQNVDEKLDNKSGDEPGVSRDDMVRGPYFPDGVCTWIVQSLTSDLHGNALLTGDGCW